jgi:hypothetical protein
MLALRRAYGRDGMQGITVAHALHASIHSHQAGLTAYTGG